MRAAISRSAPVASLRRSFHEARCALEVGALADGGAPAVALPEDLGRTGCCFVEDDDGLRQHDDGSPVERARGGNGDELLRSLEAFLDDHGNWEAAARSSVLPPAHAPLHRMSSRCATAKPPFFGHAKAVASPANSQPRLRGIAERRLV